MKKLKITLYILLSLFVVGILWNILSIIAIVFYDYGFIGLIYKKESTPLFVKIVVFSKSLVGIPFIIAVLYLYKIINLITENHYLYSNISDYFKKSGLLMGLSGFIGFILGFSWLLVTTGIVNIDLYYLQILDYDSRSMYLLLTIIGLFFIIFSQVLKDAYSTKQENDLTI